MNRRIHFLNDKSRLNKLYRKQLMDRLQKSGFNVVSIGLFDHDRHLFKVVWFLLSNSLCYMVSSNLRTNCVVLLLLWMPGLIILNGLGRHRKSRLLRIYLLHMFAFNCRKVIAIQNYGDYRYFRRHVYSGAYSRLAWVPGSGGTARSYGKRPGVQIIQRDDKIDLVADCVCDAMRLFSIKNLAVVGCSPSPRLQQLMPGSFGVGYVPQSEILCYGNIFLQPLGYGEGFPHSMSDALVSGMDVLITRKAYITYGLHQLNAPVVQSVGGWYRISPNLELKSLIAVEEISICYYNLLMSFFDV